jgi:hypothetical protein
MKISRAKIAYEEVEVPEDMTVCTHCKGKGMLSKYDEGWHSIVHSSELAALRTCMWCNGLGFR